MAAISAKTTALTFNGLFSPYLYIIGFYKASFTRVRMATAIIIPITVTTTPI